MGHYLFMFCPPWDDLLARQERLDAYYKKNYKEYFQFDAG